MWSYFAVLGDNSGSLASSVAGFLLWFVLSGESAVRFAVCMEINVVRCAGFFGRENVVDLEVNL